MLSEIEETRIRDAKLNIIQTLAFMQNSLVSHLSSSRRLDFFILIQRISITRTTERMELHPTAIDWILLKQQLHDNWHVNCLRIARSRTTVHIRSVPSTTSESRTRFRRRHRYNRIGFLYTCAAPHSAVRSTMYCGSKTRKIKRIYLAFERTSSWVRREHSEYTWSVHCTQTAERSQRQSMK